MLIKLSQINVLFFIGWTGVWDAANHRSICPNSGWFGIDAGTGNEDCLYLNVYTSQIAGSRPVMVWIHGGTIFLFC